MVGMGASAGGLEAFEAFFTQMPPDSGMAFVLVQHLAPDRASLLPALLARYTRMPVLQVQTVTPVEPDHVYVIPRMPP
jgi:two-component system CheB/CheR fusion protein